MAPSLTKHPLSEADLTKLVHAAFGSLTTVDHWSELTEGTYNAVFAVTIGDGREMVLKVAPSPTLHLLTHEVDLMRTEVDVYQKAASAGVPGPALIFADFDRTVLDTDYLFMSRVDGVAFNTVRDSMTADARASVRSQVSAAATRLHQFTATGYGYPLRDSRSWQPTWRSAFLAMVDDILTDAVRLNSRLPMPAARIGELIRRHADVLDEVQRPALVHFDLWDGNVFVEPDPVLGWRVTGLIDGERALYGDPLAELVSLGLFREFDESTLEPFGDITDNGWRRLDLYTTYLYVIMAIEGATRGWYDESRQAFENWLGERLSEQLAKL